jgi:hypothetical protein
MAMATRLQGDIEDATPGTRPGQVKRENFCMGLPGLTMIGFGNDLSLIDDHSANHGIGVRLPFSPSCQGKGTFHVEMIRWEGGHRRLEEVEDFLRSEGLAVAFFFTAIFFVIVFLAMAFFSTAFLATAFLAMAFLAGVFFVTVFFLETGFVDLATAVRFLLITFFFFEER